MEAEGKPVERQQRRERAIIDVMYCEQEVQNLLERLLELYSNGSDQAVYFLIKSWESYWRRLEYGEWLNKMKGDQKS